MNMALSTAKFDDASSINWNKLEVWKLEDAKARFSEVVRLARENAPQRITVRGEDAVVILSAQAFDKLLPFLEQPSFHGLLSQSPLNRLEFEQSGIESPIRDIEI